jgi:hypothetical protein
VTTRDRRRTTAEIGQALVLWHYHARKARDTARVQRGSELLGQLAAACRALKARTERVGLHWEADATTPSGIRAWHTMADDHESSEAWRAAAEAFRNLNHICDLIEHEIAGSGAHHRCPDVTARPVILNG